MCNFEGVLISEVWAENPKKISEDKYGILD